MSTVLTLYTIGAVATAAWLLAREARRGTVRRNWYHVARFALCWPLAFAAMAWLWIEAR